MQSRGLEVVVGLFVCLGIAAVFILTLRVSNLADVPSGQSYQVSAQFSNIGGLRSGAQVSLAGVRIGRVASIAVDQQTYEADVTMNIEQQYRIPEDSDASILTAGLLGEQYIGIGPGASDKYLEQGDEFIITQSAVILEKIIGQVLFSLTSDKAEGSGNAPGNNRNNGDSGDFGDGFGNGSNSLPAPSQLPKSGGDTQASGDKSPPADNNSEDNSAKVQE